MKTGRKILMGLLSAVLSMSMFGCGNKITKEDTFASAAQTNGVYELMAVGVESEEEARDLADKYEIEFVDYGLGVATFKTTEDPETVMKRGTEQGLKPLSINGTVTIDSENSNQ